MTKKRLLSLFMAFLLGIMSVFSGISINAFAEDNTETVISEDLEEDSEEAEDKEARASDKVTYYEKIDATNNDVAGAYFKVNDIWAYCAEAKKDSPPKDAEIKSIEESSNKKLKKVLYYGSKGPGRTKVAKADRLSDDDHGFIQTSQAASLALGNDTVNSKYEDWYKTIIKMDAPPSGFKVYVCTPKNSSYQTLVYYVYNPVGKCEVKKSSSVSGTSGNSNYSLSGAVYTVYSNKKCTTKVGTLTTNAKGESNTLTVTPGTYYVKETTAPKGYTLDSTVHEITVKEDETTTLNVKDTPVYSKLQLTKVSANSQTSGNSSYSLSGAQYGVYSNAACTTKVATLTTGADGKSNVATLLAGTYYVKETKASQGYTLNTAVLTANLTLNNTTTLSAAEYPIYGKLQLIKSSAEPGITDNNDCYSLNGAVYTVYSNSACTAKVGELTTNAKGESNVLSVLAGTYYVKETTAPKGYTLDSTVHAVTVTADSSVTVKVNVKDVPLMKEFDPYALLLKKEYKNSSLSAGGSSESKPPVSMADAEFTVKFFEGSYGENVNPEDDGVKPDRTWVMRTNEYGYCRLEDDYKVSGDDFYINPTGSVGLPLGTLVIQETKAPEGYQINNKIFIKRVEAGESGTVIYNEPAVPETVLKITITKLDAEGGKTGYIPGTEFTHVKPDGSKEVLTTNVYGRITILGLEQGNHVIYESKARDGYTLNPNNKIEFNISDKNEFSFINTDSLDSSIDYKIGSDKNGEVTFYDEKAPFTIQVHKYNDKGTLLDGAEFTLYSDEELTKVVETGITENGILSFKNLSVNKDYYLKETKAPDGYKLPEDGKAYKIKLRTYPDVDMVDFCIDDKWYTRDQTDPENDFYISGGWNDRIVNIKVVNRQGLLLPAAGSSGNLFLIFFGVLLMTGAVVVMKKPIQRRREKQNE